MRIALLHPGEMGVSVGLALQASGHEVIWCRAGRSAATRARAQTFTALDTMEEVARSCEGCLSVCPPGDALTQARAVAQTGFNGVYVDANAVAPATAAAVGALFPGRFVDGGIIGPPAQEPGSTRLYLSGERSAEVAGWFTAGPLEALDLGDLTLVCQDWGSLIGLRLVAENPDRFARVVVANGFLPTADRPVPRAFHVWRAFARYTPVFPVGRIVASGCARGLSPAARAAYDAPFPGERYKAGARAFPRLVPTEPEDPAVPDNRRAWEALGRWDKPFLTAFGDRDPIFRGADRALQDHVPGARGQPHTTLRKAGHFLQEDVGEELAAVVAEFVNTG